MRAKIRKEHLYSLKGKTVILYWIDNGNLSIFHEMKAFA